MISALKRCATNVMNSDAMHTLKHNSPGLSPGATVIRKFRLIQAGVYAADRSACAYALHGTRAVICTGCLRVFAQVRYFDLA